MRVSGFILAFTVVASVGAPAAAAECHKIFFTTLEVEDCREFGVCDWKVVCAINDQQDVTLVANEEANTNEFISINQLLTTTQAFPVTVSCSVQEHDGGIGAHWEDVMAESRDFSAPGSYTIRESNNEGAVALHFTIDSGTGGVGGTCDAATTAKTYDAIFRPGTGSQGVVYGLTWAELTDSLALNHLIGRRLEDLESYVEGGVRRYTGVFREGNGWEVLWAGASWSSLMAQRAQQAAAGYHLADFESYLEGGTRVYTGIFLPGTGGTIHAEVSWQQLNTIAASLSEQGLRIADFETYVVGGQRTYSAVFAPGSGGQYIVDGLVGAAFGDVVDEMAALNYRPVDMESYVVSGVRVYGAVFRPGTGGLGVLPGLNKATMVQRIAELRELGYRLIDLDVY
jgi:hypothetical protein